MNIKGQMALLGYAQMLDDTVSVPGMAGGEPVRIMMNEIQRLTAERDAARSLAVSCADDVQVLTHRIQSARVEIPDLTPEDMERVTGREYFNGLRTGFELARSRARVVYPAKDGGAP